MPRHADFAILTRGPSALFFIYVLCSYIPTSIWACGGVSMLQRPKKSQDDKWYPHARPQLK